MKKTKKSLKKKHNTSFTLSNLCGQLCASVHADLNQGSFGYATQYFFAAQ